MASKQEILAILKRGLSGVSDEDLNTLADQLSGAGSRLGMDSAVSSEEELKARKEFLESVGEMARARQLEEQYLESEIQSRKLLIEQLTLEEASRKAATEATEENTQATEEEAEQIQASTVSAEQLRKELVKLRARKAALTIEAKQSAKTFEFLGGVVSNTTKEFAEIADTGVNVAGVFKSLKGASKDLSGAMLNIASSDVVQGFARQTDALNQLVSEATRVFEIASQLDKVNTRLYKTMGIAGSETRKFSFELAELAGDTESLSRLGPELSQAAISLQQAQQGFDFERDKGMALQIALLEQAGFASETTSELFTLFSKSGGEMALQAENINLKLFTLARDLGMAPNQIADAFRSGMSAVAAYGSRAETVFSRLLVVSNKLGVSVNTMLGAFDDLDEMDRAADVAGKLNAILQLTGEAAIGDFELARADLAQKTLIIQRALTTPEASAMFSGETGRFFMKEVSNALRIPVEDLRKMQAMSSTELERAVKDMGDVQATSLKDLEKLNFENLDASEKASKRNEDRIGGLVDAAQATRETASSVLSSDLGRGALAILGTGLSLGLPFFLKSFGTAGLAAGGAGMGVSMLGEEASIAAEMKKGEALGQDTVRIAGPVKIDPISIGQLASAIATAAAGQDLLLGGGKGGKGGGAKELIKSAGRFVAPAAAVALAGKDAVDIATTEGEAKKEDTYGLVGSIIGAAIGLAIPGVGTLIGPAIGSIALGTLGSIIGGQQDSSQVSAKRHIETLEKLGQLRTNENVGDDFRINSSDEIIGVKEGGLIAKKLDKLISIMSDGGTKQDVILQIDGNEVGRAAVKSINNNFYNMRD